MPGLADMIEDVELPRDRRLPNGMTIGEHLALMRAHASELDRLFAEIEVGILLLAPTHSESAH